MNLQEKYPKLFEQLEDKEVELRHLLNVDENEEDYDSEEFEFDYEDYNFIIYIAEPVQKVLGEEKMQTLTKKLEASETFENFMASEEDLYGVKCTLNADEIAELILTWLRRWCEKVLVFLFAQYMDMGSPNSYPHPSDRRKRFCERYGSNL